MECKMIISMDIWTSITNQRFSQSSVRPQRMTLTVIKLFMTLTILMELIGNLLNPIHPTCLTTLSIITKTLTMRATTMDTPLTWMNTMELITVMATDTIMVIIKLTTVKKENISCSKSSRIQNMMCKLRLKSLTKMIENRNKTKKVNVTSTLDRANSKIEDRKSRARVVINLEHLQRDVSKMNKAEKG